MKNRNAELETILREVLGQDELEASLPEVQAEEIRLGLKKPDSNPILLEIFGGRMESRGQIEATVGGSSYSLWVDCSFSLPREERGYKEWKPDHSLRLPVIYKAIILFFQRKGYTIFFKIEKDYGEDCVNFVASKSLGNGTFEVNWIWKK